MLLRRFTRAIYLALALSFAFVACGGPQSTPRHVLGASALSQPWQSVKAWGAKGDGTTDDSAAFQAAVNALAGTGVALFVPSGTFNVNATVNLKSNLRIVMTPSTTIDATGLANSGTANAAANAIFLGQPSSLTTTTLSSPASAGAVQISVAANLFSVGGWLVMTPTHLGANASLRDKMYQVKNIAGAGPYTIDLDRALLNDYSTSDVVQLFVPLSNVRIEGNGATIKGVCNRAIEMLGALDSYIGYLNFVGTWTDYVTSWDVPSFRCLSDHLVIDGGQTALACQAFEATEDTWAVHGQATGCVFGYSFQDNNGGGLVDCTASYLKNQSRTGYDGVGVQFGDDGSNGIGALGTTIRGGTFTFCAFAGAYVQTASNGTLFDGVNFSHNPKYAVAIEGDVATDRTTIRRCNLSYAGDTALYIPQPVVTNTLVEDSDLSYPTNQATLIQGGPTVLRRDKAYVTGTATITGGASGLLGSGYELLVDGGVYDAQDTGLTYLFQTNGPTIRLLGGVRVGVKHALSTGVATETGSSATAYVEHATFYDSSGGAGTNLVALRSEAGSIWVGDGFDATNFTYKIFSGGGGVSRATVVANGTTPVAVAFVSIKASSQVNLVRVTNGGTPGKLPLVTITAGTGFSITADASDTSTYAYEVR